MTGTINETTASNEEQHFFFKKIKKNLALHREKRVVVVNLVTTVDYVRCSHSFCCSRSKRLQRVVHTTPTMRANICVLSKLTWRLCKQMHLHFSSKHFHITKLRLVI